MNGAFTLNEPYICLNDLEIGKCATVMDIRCRDDMATRLGDIGLVPGTKVTCLQRSPLGDPVAFRIRGAVIALRCEDTRRIIVG